MRLLITGSRKWKSRELIRDRLLLYPEGTIVVHGNAWGADQLAAIVAREVGQIPEPHPVSRDDWERLGLAAGSIRNQLMVDLGADWCEAFPHRDSVGTFDCMKRARMAGIPVEETWED